MHRANDGRGCGEHRQYERKEDEFSSRHHEPLWTAMAAFNEDARPATSHAGCVLIHRDFHAFGCVDDAQSGSLAIEAPRKKEVFEQDVLHKFMSTNREILLSTEEKKLAVRKGPTVDISVGLIEWKDAEENKCGDRLKQSLKRAEKGQTSDGGQEDSLSFGSDGKHRIEHVRLESAVGVGEEDPIALCVRCSNMARVTFACPIRGTMMILNETDARVACRRGDEEFARSIGATVEDVDHFEIAKRLSTKCADALLDDPRFVVRWDDDREETRSGWELIAVGNARDTLFGEAQSNHHDQCDRGEEHAGEKKQNAGCRHARILSRGDKDNRTLRDLCAFS